MRVNIGNRRSRQTAPVARIPQYYQYHLENPGADVTIAAWQCAVQAPPSATPEWFERNCTLPMENVSFTITDTTGDGETSAPAAIIPPHFGLGDLRIAATAARDYAPKPYLLCEIASPDDVNQPAAGSAIRCNWYTWHLQPADITVYAWECPDGYDITAPTSDPMSECSGIASGVQFRLRNSDPDRDFIADSVAYRIGAARFGDLEPGEYTLSERIDSENPEDTIVWQCFGMNGERAQPSRATGSGISFSISGGEHILCHRFHIRQRAER